MPGDHMPFDEATLRRLDELTDDGRAAVIVRDAHHATVWVSDNATSVTGLRPRDLSERMYSLVPPEDQQVLADLSKAMREGDARVGAANIRVGLPDGRVQPFDLRLYDLLHDPGVRGVVAVLRPSRSAVVLGGLLHGLQTVSTDLLMVQNDEPRTTYVSPSVERLLGVMPDNVLHLGRELVHADDLGPFLAARRRVLDGGPDERLRMRLRHADGSERTFDTVIADHFDDPTIGGLLLVARDITELAHTETELAETRAVFEAVLSNAADLALTVDRDGIVGFCGANVTELLGFVPEDLVGHDAFSFVHPDDRELALRTFLRFLDGEEETDPLLRILQSDGSYLLVEIIGTDCTDVPELACYVLSVRDVSDRLHQQRRYDAALRHASGAAVILDLEGKQVWSSHGIESYAGDVRSIPDALGLDMFESDPPIDELAFFASIVEGGPGTTGRVLGRLGPPGMEKRWVEVVLTNLTDDPAVDGIVCNIQDVNAVVRANEAGRRLGQVLESTTDMAMIFDADLEAIWGNAAARAVFGTFPVSGSDLTAALPEWVWATVRTEARPALRTESTWRGELAVRRPDGLETPLDTIILVHRDTAGDVEYYSLVARDISERKALEHRLHARARHDPLTGLPNRVLLAEQLERALETGRPPLGVLFLDLDQFKEVNDTRGHDVGDRLLLAAADRLRDAAREDDLVARFGGDEFVVLLGDVSSLETAHERATEVLAALRGPVQLDELEVFLTASVGVTVASDTTDATDLIARADTAMYAAKDRGRDQVASYAEHLRTRSVHRLDTAQQLRRALEYGELDVWFQPIVDTVLRSPIGLEALVRWNHPTRGVVTPDQFIPVAEETGLILPLGVEVLARTCATIADIDRGAAELTVAVNVSARQLVDPELPGRISELLDRHGILPPQLCLEITESAVMRDLSASTRALEELCELGVSIAVDDFGTGYSSLAYLKRFPVDILKIDREFVTGLHLGSDWNRSLAGGIISLGHSLGVSVVAEGVETTEQADLLGRLDCDALQGFLFSRPVPPDDLSAMLTRLGRQARLPVTES